LHGWLRGCSSPIAATDDAGEPGLYGVSGSVGEYTWGGAAGTAFWVDPKEEMVSVLMTQCAPGPARGYTRTLFRQLVRQAIVG